MVGRILLKYSEKKVIIHSALLFGATFLACIALRSFWSFFVVRIFQGIALAGTDTAVLAFILNITPLAYRVRTIGYFMLAPPFATVIAPALGMFLVNQYSFTVFFLSCAGMSLCAFFSSCTLRSPAVEKLDQGTAPHNTSFFQWKILVPALNGFLHNFIWGSVGAFFPLYAIQCGVANPGFFFSAIAVMMIAGRVLGGRIFDAWGNEKIIPAFIFVSMIAMVILSFSRTLPMFVVAGLLWGLSCAFFFPACMTYALDYANSSGGPAVGTFRALQDLGLALGPTIMGIIIRFTGYQAMFSCLALVCLINLGYFQFYVRKKAHVASNIL